MKKFSFFLASMAAAFLISGDAFAQNIPSAAEASRAQRQIAPIDRTISPESASGLVSSSVPLAAPAGSEKVRFVLNKITVDGATAYTETEIGSIYGDRIGQEISLADVYGFAQQLTVKYRNDGYILTQVVVPEQTIEGGNVRLRVVEGFADQVRVEGDLRGRPGFLQGFAERIRADRPLNARKLERYILLMNDLAGVSAKAVLSPSARTVGASDVTIVITQDPYDLFGQIDNRGSRYLGPLQVNAGARINNPFGLYESISLQAVTAFSDATNRELDYFGFAWGQPLNNEGTKLTVGASITETEPGFDIAIFDVEGLAKNVNVELSHPFIRTRNNSLFAALKFNSLDSRRSDNISLADTVDRLRVLRLAGTWQVTDSLVGINTVNLEASKGLGIFGASDEGDANLTRAAGDPQFFKTTLELSRLQRVTGVFDVFLSAVGQSTPDELLASEEFGVGGVNYGSAYDSSEITGDEGVAGRIELRANNPVQTPADTLQLYAFYDIGKVWDRDNALPSERIRSLASAGAGFRASINENFASTFEAAKPLTRDVGTENDDDMRFFGTLTARF